MSMVKKINSNVKISNHYLIIKIYILIFNDRKTFQGQYFPGTWKIIPNGCHFCQKITNLVKLNVHVKYIYII